MHILSLVTDNPSWIRGREENGHKNYFMINLHESMGPGLDRTHNPWICRHITDCAMPPGAKVISRRLQLSLAGKEVNSFLTSSDFCRLVITLANSSNPDQDQENVGPDLDPSCLTLWVFLKFLLKSYFWKKSADDNKSIKNYPACKQFITIKRSFVSHIPIT